MMAGFCMAAWLWTAAGMFPFDEAAWLRDPRHGGYGIVNVFHREHEKPDNLPEGPRNLHTLFRHEFELRETPASAVLVFSADDYAVLYCNGQRIGQGPEGGYPWAHPFQTLEISAFLREGVNCLGVHLFYQGLINRVWCSGDNRSGFAAELRITYADGSSKTIATDPASWPCLPLIAFTGEETIGYKTQFLEHIDMRQMPQGWNTPGFDDADWIEPLTEWQDHVFVPQETPPLQVYPVRPREIRKIGKDHYFYDFGREIVGHTRIRIRGNAGDILTVRHGEELIEPYRVRYDMRANCRYEELPILSGMEDVIEFFDYRAFRYIEILDAPSEPDVWVDVRHFPFDDRAVQFESDDATLKGIWDLCAHGVRMGCQGGMLDCPSREKGQYLGDAVITSRSHLWLTGDGSLTRKALLEFMASQRICPGMMAVAPGSFMQEIAEYSLQFPLMAWKYYEMTGDRALLQRVADEALPQLFEYFSRFESDKGLLEGFYRNKEKWVLVDWPADLRDNFDYDYAEGRANAVLNAFYYGGLRTAARIEREVGRDGIRYDTRADRVAAGFAEHLVDPESRLYVDAPGSRHSSLHANAVPLAFGLYEGADRTKILDLIREKKLNCGVYIASYVIEACFQQGAAQLGWELLTSDSDHSWKEMLRQGATACTEVWNPDQKKNMSWCHPWASSPIYLIIEYVMGIRPAVPGWQAIRVAPPSIAGLPALSVRVPVTTGTVQVAWDPASRIYTVITPEGIPVETLPPDGTQITATSRVSFRKPVMNEKLVTALARAKWTEKVGKGRGILVSIPEQRLYLIEDGLPVWQAACSTAAKGVGAEINSEQTPPGWHRVAEKVGDGAPWGTIFRSRASTGRRWKPGEKTDEDLVLTRILWLEGTEDGINTGRNQKGISVDSKARAIYIHGTNDEDRIGTPASHGCVRMLNDDVITLFDRCETGNPVYIDPGNQLPDQADGAV